MLGYRITNYNELFNKLGGHETELLSREITIQVTDDCQCACSYCYQGNKGHKKMTKETAKKIIDLLFKMYDEDEPGAYINKQTPGIILDFIGGEPLLNIEVIDYTCTYFYEKCMKLNHPWLFYWRIVITSNGQAYFNPEVKNFLNKFSGLISFDVSIDGPKEIHDACRKYHNGKGNFDDAYKAFKDYKDKGNFTGTKVTISKENLLNLTNIVKFFINEGIYNINANTVAEADWTIDDAKKYYAQLKELADYILNLESTNELYVGFFSESLGHPLPESNQDCWCGGGSGTMLAFDPDGIAYPCLRYMESSLNGDQPPLIVGDTDGIYKTEEQKKLFAELKAVTRRSKTTDECYYCPVASECADCAAWNYQCTGSLNSKSTKICVMHKARSLANVYFWNKYYQKVGENKIFNLDLPEKDALKIINENEYNLLKELAKKGNNV